jgi:hypothetical protein
MAMDVRAIKEWLNTLTDDTLVGIDEGGLMLETVAPKSSYYEGSAPADISVDGYLEIGASISSEDLEQQTGALKVCRTCGDIRRNCTGDEETYDEET